jgi:hypothetical protein
MAPLGPLVSPALQSGLSFIFDILEVKSLRNPLGTIATRRKKASFSRKSTKIALNKVPIKAVEGLGTTLL